MSRTLERASAIIRNAPKLLIFSVSFKTISLYSYFSFSNNTSPDSHTKRTNTFPPTIWYYRNNQDVTLSNTAATCYMIWTRQRKKKSPQRSSTTRLGELQRSVSLHFYKSRNSKSLRQWQVMGILERLSRGNVKWMQINLTVSYPIPLTHVCAIITCFPYLAKLETTSLFSSVSQVERHPRDKV